MIRLLTVGFNSKRTSQAISPFSQQTFARLSSSFQFQADFPSHFTIVLAILGVVAGYVSIPSGLPKPFHPRYITRLIFGVWVSIPSGLPKPFHPGYITRLIFGVWVSIPSGLPKPFHPGIGVIRGRGGYQFQFQADFPSHFTSSVYVHCPDFLRLDSKRTSQAISPRFFTSPAKHPED